MVALLLLLVFLALVAAMVSGRLPALLALPLLALATGVLAGLPYFHAEGERLAATLAAQPPGAPLPPELEAFQGVGSAWLWSLARTLDLLAQEVVGKGVPRLSRAVFAVMLGGVFGKLLEVSGVARELVRRVAELAGDRVFGLTVALTLTTSFLFTALGGLGAVIMVAGVVFPVLLSVGVPPVTAGSVFLMGFSLGGVFNLVNWALYLEVLGLEVREVAGFALPFGVVYMAVLLVFLVVELRRARIPVEGASIARAVAALAVLAGGAGWVVSRGLHEGLAAKLAGPFGVLVLALALAPRPREGPGVPALLAPLVPIGLVLFLGWGIPAAFVGGVLFLALKAPGTGRDQLLARALLEGVQGVTPAVCLMMGIGMVLVAFWHPSVTGVLGPLVTAWVPSSPGKFVAFFALAAPLALYRGPLNLWGMGFGLAGILHKSGALAPRQIMVAFLSDGQLQGVCDPTNTHNVWIANELDLDPVDLLKRTLPYVWVLAALGLALGAYGG